MSREPEVFCPKCGARAVVIVWYSDDPGTGFGCANCMRCGGIDYKVRYNRVVESVLADPQAAEESGEDLLSREEYDRELVEYMLEQGLV